jgi:hypothetical protein
MLKVEFDTKHDVQTDFKRLQPIIDAIKAEQRILQEERARARVAALFTR